MTFFVVAAPSGPEQSFWSACDETVGSRLLKPRTSCFFNRIAGLISQKFIADIHKITTQLKEVLVALCFLVYH